MKKNSTEKLLNLFHGPWENTVFSWSLRPHGKPKPTLLDFSNITMWFHSGAEERGCDYRVKKTRIYVQLHLKGSSSSRRVLRTRPYIL
jgi:hypothetical protein